MTLGRGLATAAQGVINLAKRKSWRNIPQAGGSGVVSTNGIMYQLAPVDDNQIIANTSGSQDIPVATDYTTTYLDKVFGASRGSVIYRGASSWASLAGSATGSFLQSNTGSDPTWSTATTSIALSMPVQFSVAGSPITSTGTFTVTWATEAANKVLAGPTTGAAAAPTFRLLVAADIPDLSAVYLPLTGGTLTGVITDKIYTVATLPTPVVGMRTMVSDATATTFASIVAGTGGNTIPVYYDGTNWRIG